MGKLTVETAPGYLRGDFVEPEGCNTEAR